MYKSIVILTGAGISAESGIDTFRAKDGLWENHHIEDVATPEGFARDPDLVHRFYNARRAASQKAMPNAAHIALAKLEQIYAREGFGAVTIITQNVDDLHERAGSKTLLHMHGDLLHLICTQCDFRGQWREPCLTSTKCPECQNISSLRPDIVWFGEMPYFMERIEAQLASCDLFVSIGTSGAVYPAAGFVKMAKAHGVKTLELNLEPSEGSAFFDETRRGKAGDIVPLWVDDVLGANA